MDILKNIKECGIELEELIEEKDIVDKNNNFTGYHKKVSIKDYGLVTGDNTKQPNLLKQITVEISYKLGKEDKNVKISIYIKKE